jgi:hypothetical protein
MYKVEQGGDKEEYGGGFTIYNLLDNIDVDRSDIKDKIANEYFDYVVYSGEFLYCAKPFVGELPLFAETRFSLSKSRIAIVDGDDEQTVYGPINALPVPYFKREIPDEWTGVQAMRYIPISFAMPLEKMVDKVPEKHFDIAVYRPGMPYMYSTERAYYQGYRASWAAHTQKKAGWDCMRHYEIMGNGCIPLFKDLHKLPRRTCTTLPRAMLKEALEIDDMNTDRKMHLADDILRWTRNHCTTEALAKQFLTTMRLINER